MKKLKLKLWAYEKGGDKLLKLDQVTIQTDPETLRKIAMFFNACADEMEESPLWDHVHLKDHLKIRSAGSDIIVAK
jgi:hypothetical protein